MTIQSELHSIALQLKEVYIQENVNKGKTASKRLINSLEVNETTYVGEFGIGYKAEILGLPYWWHLDKGRGPTKSSTPGNPTLKEAILQWIKDKQIIPYPDSKGRIPSLNSLAYVIARKIHREGYKRSDVFGEPTERFMSNPANFERLNEAIVKSVFDNKTIEI